MARQLPKTLYVKVEKDGGIEYFTADESADCLVDMGEKVKIGTYQLVDVSTAKGVAKFDKVPALMKGKCQ